MLDEYTHFDARQKSTIMTKNECCLTTN